MLLDKIKSKYSIASLRTEALSSIILQQAKKVLDRLFFPKQIKF